MKTPRPSAFAALRRDRHNFLATALVGALALTAAASRAQEHAIGAEHVAEHTDDAAELAKKLQNPIASLISVPLQNNFDFGAGPHNDGFQYLVRIQPVVPFALTEDWNVISRTILPVIYQENIFGTSSQSGLGDTLQSFFFSPKANFHGWIWGAGPVLQLPTATDDLLGQEKWGAGPTAVLLKQQAGWTYGALVNHVWSFAAEDENRRAVSQTFLQPFVSYTFKTHTTLALNTESAYNWKDPQWTVPVNLSIKQFVKFGNQPVQFELGGRYYAEKPDNGPDWGLRFTVTFLFPK